MRRPSWRGLKDRSWQLRLEKAAGFGDLLKRQQGFDDLLELHWQGLRLEHPTQRHNNDCEHLEDVQKQPPIHKKLRRRVSINIREKELYYFLKKYIAIKIW